METNDRKKVWLLFSGGWDSTFRLLQLCQHDIDIQPVYVVNEGRQSVPYEKKAIDRIVTMARERFAANVLTPVFYSKAWVFRSCRNAEVSKAYRHARERFDLGYQYEWLALLCHALDIDMEIGNVHHSPGPGTVEGAIQAESRLVPVADDFLPHRFRTAPAGENDRIHTLFSHFIYPIIEYTKQDEERISRENGWADIMHETWFCHSPIRGEPCGVCSPCCNALRSGMAWQLPEKALRRNRFKGIIRPVLWVKNRVRLRLGKKAGKRKR